MIKTTIVGFGDSLTYGYGVDFHINYVDRLERYMPQYFPFISWNIINSGINGDTTRGALKRLEKDVLRYNPNIVIVLFGTNDSASFEEYHCNLEEYKNNYSKLITKIKTHNNRTGLNGCIPIPLLLTPPPVIDCKAMPFTQNQKIQQYASVVKELAKQHHCPLVDFNSYLIEESEGKLEDYLQTDGVHLNVKGYDCLYDCIFSGISRLINYEGILKDYDIISDDII